MDAATDTTDQARPVGPGVRDAVMAQARAVAGEPPKPMPRAVLCPYCGGVSALSGRCSSCGGRFDPLSRQATQNHMGPWFIREERNPHRPGCTYETLCRLVDAGSVGPDTVLRGPSTRQFWSLARHAPGVAHRLGWCHNCREPVAKDAFQCPKCHAAFGVDRDRQHLGIGPFRPLPGQGTPEVLAMHAGPARAGGMEPKDFTRNAGAGGSSGAPASEELVQAASQARAAAADWRRERDLERTRGVIALVLAGLVVLTSLMYTGLSISGNVRDTPDEPVPAPIPGE